MIIALFESLRPKQWTKNLLVFAGYLFTINQTHPPGTFLRVLAAFGLFCGLTGATYILNDAVDVECDRRHPFKCKRPIASERIPVRAAVIFALILAGAAIWASLRLELYFGLLAAGYFVLTMAYSAGLKHLVIVDLLVIAAGFVIRAAAGAIVIRVTISPWLLVCTTLLALFLGLAKRRAELVNLENGHHHRRALSDYTTPMLEQMLTISAAACLMGYFLYTFSPSPVTGETHPQMMITVPFVIYGLFRYLFLIHDRDAGASPEQVLLEDRPLLIDIILYVVAAAVALKM
ncbi:MAG: decaprenyl-phosphate phosphoribosyltransferase [Armatimonadota bacterium]